MRKRSYILPVCALSASLAISACKDEPSQVTHPQATASNGQELAVATPSAPATPAAPSCDAVKAQVKEVTHGGPYAQVRAKLIAIGWAPIAQSRPPLLEDGSEDFASKSAWDAGFREVESCSGTGLAPCSYRFSDKFGNKLKIVGIGEDPPSQQIDSAVVTCAGSKTGVGSSASQNDTGPARTPSKYQVPNEFSGDSASKRQAIHPPVPHRPSAYDGQTSLVCGENVNCDKLDDIVTKMRKRWMASSSSSPYSSQCLAAIDRISELSAQWEIWSADQHRDIAQGQMNACNMR